MPTASFILLAALLATRPVEGPFQDLTFDQALAAAERDNKVVMIDFSEWTGFLADSRCILNPERVPVGPAAIVATS